MAFGDIVIPRAYPLSQLGLFSTLVLLSQHARESGQEKKHAMADKRFPDGFYIGGATSDWQFEGGFGEGDRGLLSVDFATDGNQQNPRQVTWIDKDGNRGKSHWEAPLPEGATLTMFAMSEFYDRYHKPLLVIENGMGAIDVLEEDGSVHNQYRIEYLSKHLSAIRDAICEDGVDCIGYTMWGNIDLVSRSTGEMAKRYGFVYVDMDDKGYGTLKRSRKDSFWWMKKACESNGADLTY